MRKVQSLTANQHINAPDTRRNNSRQPNHLEISGYFFPKDVVFQYIFPRLSPGDQINMMGICKNWHDFIFNYLEVQISKGLLFQNFPLRVIGVSQWIQCFGKENLEREGIDLTDIPLNKRAVIARLIYLVTHSEIEEDAGATILYRLQGFTLKKIKNLVRKRLKGYIALKVADEIVTKFGDIPITETSIEIVTNNIFKKSRNLSIDSHQNLVKKYGCEIPTSLSVVSLAILTDIIFNIRLFNNEHLTYTRCREQGIVGGFMDGCLNVETHFCSVGFESRGVAGSIVLPSMGQTSDHESQFSSLNLESQDDVPNVPSESVLQERIGKESNRKAILNLIAEAQRCITKHRLAMRKDLGIEAIQSSYEKIAEEIYLMQNASNPNESMLTTLVGKLNALDNHQLDSLFKTVSPIGFSDLCDLYRQLRSLFDKELSILREKMMPPDSLREYPQRYSVSEFECEKQQQCS